jgi:16S rRNA (guanine966-N2)-methyltransferase
MRIIGGIHKGRSIVPPKGLPVRPTTDFAKEALFNILNNQLNFDELSVLDLFSGTGHISLEFASRGAKQITAVDQNFKCIGFLKSMSSSLNLDVNTVKQDVFDFLKSNRQTFDLIFADPPYDLTEIPMIHQLIVDKQLLNPNGMLIIEHGSKTSLESLVFYEKTRRYGNVNFSFFRNTQ